MYWLLFEREESNTNEQSSSSGLDKKVISRKTTEDIRPSHLIYYKINPIRNPKVS